MIRTLRCLSLPALAFLALAAVPAARAGVATETFTHTIVPTSVPFTDNFTLPSFNPSLGTLTGVSVTMSLALTAEIDVINTSTTAQTFNNATATFSVTSTGPAGLVMNADPVTGPISGTAAPAQGATATFTRFPGLTAFSSSTVQILAPSFGPYVGGTGSPMTFTASLNNATFAGITSSPNLYFGGSAVEGGTISVNYTYTTADTSVPEPASLVMVGLGLAGAAAARFRRRSA
jgi:hypothetical protein